MNTSNLEASVVYPFQNISNVSAAVVSQFYAIYGAENKDPVDAEIASLINKPTKKELKTQAVLENILKWLVGKNLLASEALAFITPNLDNLGGLIDTTIMDIQTAKKEGMEVNIKEVLAKAVIDNIDNFPLPEEVKAEIVKQMFIVVEGVKNTKPSEETITPGKEEDGIAKVTVVRRRPNNR